MAVLAVLIVAPVLRAAAPAAAAGPTANATPDRGLSDGQTITVAASGFPAMSIGGVYECTGAVVDRVDDINQTGDGEIVLDYCDQFALFDDFSAGAASTDFVVSEKLR